MFVEPVGIAAIGGRRYGEAGSAAENVIAESLRCLERSLALQRSARDDRLEAAIHASIRFLDDVIEMNPYPLAIIDETVKANRRIGLGIMGWADLLFLLGIPYDSQAAIDLADRLMAFVKQTAHDQSAKLAEERGPFPNWSHSIYRDIRPMRNSSAGLSKSTRRPAGEYSET